MFLCLTRKHQSKDCKRKKTWEVCGFGYNTLTHRTKDRLENASIEPSKETTNTTTTAAAASQNISVNTLNVECSATDQSGSVGRLDLIPVKVKVGQGHFSIMEATHHFTRRLSVIS